MQKYRPQKRYRAFFTLGVKSMSLDLYTHPLARELSSEGAKIYIARQLNLSVRELDKVKILKVEKI
jgi:hypothetical protein